VRSVIAVAAALGVAAVLPATGHAQSSPYAGQTITIVCGYKAGGGYDRIARLLAKHLPQHIPGKPTIIVQNMPGANSIIAANYIYNVAKPDGMTLGTFNRNLPIAQLLHVQGVQYDMRKFAWIGSAASEATLLTIRSDLPYRTLADLRQAKQPIVVGATGPGANTYDFPLLLKEMLGANLKIVSGYSSSSDIMLAIERKEVDARAGSYTSIVRFIDRGLVRPVIRARAVEPGIEKLPMDENFAPNPRAKAIMALRSAPDLVGRPYVMPPNTPEAAVKIMQAAFAATIADPALKADAKKAKMDLNYVDGKDSLAVMNEVLQQPKDIVDEFSKYIKFGE